MGITMTDRAEFREERKLTLDYWKTLISIGSVLAIGLGVIQWRHSNAIYKDDLDTKLASQWRDNIKILVDSPKVSACFLRELESSCDHEIRPSAISFADL